MIYKCFGDNSYILTLFGGEPPFFLQPVVQETPKDDLTIKEGPWGLPGVPLPCSPLGEGLILDRRIYKLCIYYIHMRRLIMLGMWLVVLIFLCGCVGGESGDTAVPDEVDIEQFDTVTHATVFVLVKNWDADAENDGIVIYPDLKDAENVSVRWSDAELTVDIKLYTTRLNDSFQVVKDRVAYSGTGTIDSWKDGNILYSGGIQVPFDDITNYDMALGICFVTIHTPVGDFEAEHGLTPLTA